MDLSSNWFAAYFDRKIDMEELIKTIGIDEEGFNNYLLDELNSAGQNHDSIRLEYLVFVLFLMRNKKGDERVFLTDYIDILDQVLVEDWHNQHENIVLLLEVICNEKSLPYLYKTVFLQPEYLSWDDNHALEVKCIRAIYRIGKEQAGVYLENLCLHENRIIREMAQKQLNKLS